MMMMMMMIKSNIIPASSCCSTSAWVRQTLNFQGQRVKVEFRGTQARCKVHVTILPRHSKKKTKKHRTCIALCAVDHNFCFTDADNTCDDFLHSQDWFHTLTVRLDSNSSLPLSRSFPVCRPAGLPRGQPTFCSLCECFSNAQCRQIWFVVHSILFLKQWQTYFSSCRVLLIRE